MKSGGRSSSSAQRELMTGICRSLVTSMIPWLMFSSVNWSWSAFWRALSSLARMRSIAPSTIRVRIRPTRQLSCKSAREPLVNFIPVHADADQERMPANLPERDQPAFAGRRVDVLECRVDRGLRAPEHLGVAELLPELESTAAAAARTNHAVLSDQGDGGRRAEIDPVVEVCQMRRVQRGDDNAAELAFAVQKAPRELDRPLLAGAADDRLADEQAVVGAVEMDAIVLAVAEIDHRRGLRAGVGRPHDALGVNDRDLDDDLAQKICRTDDRMKVRGVLARLDGAPQIEQRLVDLADRSQHVLFEHHRKIAIGSFGLALVAADVLEVLEADAAPQHGDDHHAKNRRASTLGDKFWELRQMQFHERRKLAL